MKVFLSWSGERSQQMALALREWLPVVLQFVTPWLSETDIAAGQRWAPTLAKELEASNFGVICLTRENVGSPWVLFEAGSLAKLLQESAVVPFLLDLELGDLTGPLAQFQAKKVNKESTYELVVSINQAAEKAGDKPVDHVILGRLFAALWSQLDSKLSSIPPAKTPAGPVRTQADILEELVSTVRAADQRVRGLEEVGSALQTLDIRVRGLEEQLSQFTLPTWATIARDLLVEGKKIQAIKVIRQYAGIGLKEAKDLADAWEQALHQAAAPAEGQPGA